MRLLRAGDLPNRDERSHHYPTSPGLPHFLSSLFTSHHPLSERHTTCIPASSQLSPSWELAPREPPVSDSQRVSFVAATTSPSQRTAPLPSVSTRDGLANPQLGWREASVAQRAQPVKIAIGIAYRAACRRGRKPEPAIIGNRAADASAPALRSEPDIATMNLISVDSNDSMQQ